MKIGDRIRDLSGTEYVLEQAYNAGVQAEAFRARRASGNTQERLAVKIYKNPEKDRIKRLNRIIASTRNVNKGLPARTLCFPVSIIQNRYAEGVVMPHTPENSIQMSELFETPQELPASPKAFEAVTKGRVQYKTLLLNAFHLARATERLYRNGFAHCDFSISNVFIHRTNGSVSVIDADNLAVEGFLPAKVSGTSGYMAPELESGQKKAPDHETDAHSLAVPIFNLLVFRHPLVGSDMNVDFADDPFGKNALYTDHPANMSNRFRGGFDLGDLPQDIQNLFYSAFVEGLHDPQDRPSATKWISPLWNAIELLYTCEKCRQTTFFTHQTSARCLFCEHQNKRFFALLKFSNGFVKVVEADSILYPHHFFGNVRQYDLSEKLADFKIHKSGHFIFANRSNYDIKAEFVTGAAKTISLNKGCALSQVKRIYFSDNIYADIETFFKMI